jgi:hypothetical protein
MSLRGVGIQSRHGKARTPLDKHPRGMGSTALCERCNNFTGQQFGDAFADWTVQCQRYSDKIGSSKLYVSFDITPLPVIEEILTMGLAASPGAHPNSLKSLRRFILTPFERYVPDRLGIYAYFNPHVESKTDPPNKMIGDAMIIKFGEGPQAFVLAEVAFPPMGYVIVVRDEHYRNVAEKEGLCDITFFGEISRRRTLWLSIPVKRPIGPFPIRYLDSPND